MGSSQDKIYLVPCRSIERDFETEGRVLKMMLGPTTLTQNMIRRGLASS